MKGFWTIWNKKQNEVDESSFVLLYYLVLFYVYVVNAALTSSDTLWQARDAWRMSGDYKVIAKQNNLCTKGTFVDAWKMLLIDWLIDWRIDWLIDWRLIATSTAQGHLGWRLQTALYTSDTQISYTHLCCFTSVCPFVRYCVEGKISRKFALCFV